MAEKKNLLIVLRHSPYGSGLGRAAVDTALAFAAFEQEVELLFVGDGVLQLSPGQQGQSIGRKTIEKQLAALPLYGVDSVFVDATASLKYNIDLTSSPVPATALSEQEMHRLMDHADHLLSF